MVSLTEDIDHLTSLSRRIRKALVCFPGRSCWTFDRGNLSILILSGEQVKQLIQRHNREARRDVAHGVRDDEDIIVDHSSTGVDDVGHIT